MYPLFIALTQTNGSICHVNARQIRAVFPHGEGGSSVNIGTAANISVFEKPSAVLAQIDDAFARS